MDPAWIAAFVALATAVVSLLAWAARYGWRVLRRTGHFLDDWQGEPAHDGLTATPGVMARLRSLEDFAASINAELHPNGGGSLRDVVARTAADVADIKQDQASMRARMELWESQRAGREKP
jgi:hypothetical protein